jgi:hypothetical protein
MIFSTTINSTIQIVNSTEKYIYYAFIILISCILFSILAYIFIICIKQQQHQKRKSDLIRSPSTIDITQTR